MAMRCITMHLYLVYREGCPVVVRSMQAGIKITNPFRRMSTIKDRHLLSLGRGMMNDGRS